MLLSPVAAFAQSASSAPPKNLGGTGANSQKIAPSNSVIKVQERTDNIVDKKKQVKSAREKREEKKGRIGRDEIERYQLEKGLSGALDKEITYMEKLLPKLPKGNDQRPEILRRLVENYHQRSLLSFFEESRDYDKAWAAWDKGGRRGTEPLLSQDKSKAWISRLIQRAQLMITDYPKNKRIDEAYFQIGFALDSQGQRKEGAAYYSQLVGKFPNSKRVPDSHFALGEFYFDQQDFKKALTAFNEVQRYTRSPIYPWAMYKIAWCHFNLQDYRNSIGAFKNVVRLSNSAAGLSAAGKIRLKEEALREMVNVYAELGVGAEAEAEQYFAQEGGEKYYGDLLIRLAEILRERGEYDRSIRILKKFVTKNPMSVKAAEIQIQIVDVANLLPDKRTLWAELKGLLQSFGPDSLWAKKNAPDKGFKELSERIHTVALTYPKKVHAEAQKEGNKVKFEQAVTGYNIYLTFYGNRPDSMEVRFYLGEIQYNAGQYPDAVRTFTQITNLKEKSPFFQKSAEYLLSASYLPIEKELKDIKSKAAKVGQAQTSISPGLQNYVRVCDQFISWFPKDKRVLDCQVDTADLYLKSNNYPEAEKRLLVLAKTYPTRVEGKNSAEALLFISQNNKPKLLAVSDDLYKIPQYQQGDLGKRLAQIQESGKLEKIKSIESSGKFLDAAKAYEKIGTTNPNSPEADKSWFNAGVNYRKAGEADKAVECFTKVYSNYPKSSAAPEALLNIIDMTSDRLQLDKAAQHSMIFLARFPQDKRAPKVASETCFLYEALNDPSNATKVCSQVMNSKGPDSAEAAKSLAEIYERNGRYSELRQIIDNQIMRSNLNATDKIIFLAKAAEADRKTGNAGGARGRENQIMQIFSSSPSAVQGEALAKVGQIEFDKQLPVSQRFNETKLQARKPDGSDLMQSIQAKSALLQNVEGAFKTVLKTGDSEWGVASLYTIGNAYEKYGFELQNAPMPPGAPAADVKKLKDTLSNLGKGLQEKSKAFYLQAAESVTKFGVYSDYSRKISDALSRTAPKEFKRADEWIPDTIFVGSQWVEVGGVKKAIDQLGGK
jgi:TolA-binding protein